MGKSYKKISEKLRKELDEERKRSSNAIQQMIKLKIVIEELLSELRNPKEGTFRFEKEFRELGEYIEEVKVHTLAFPRSFEKYSHFITGEIRRMQMQFEGRLNELMDRFKDD